MDENRYPGFNGVFFKVVYSHKKGAFIDSPAGLKDLRGNVPFVEVPFKNTKVVAGSVERVPNVNPVFATVGDEKTQLPSEYALSGWFNWDVLDKQ